MSRLLLASLSLLLSFNSLAQANVDSLWRVWNDHSVADSTRLGAIYEVIWDKYMFTDPDSARYYSREMLKRSIEVGLDRYRASALNAQGVSYAVVGALDSAIVCFDQCVEIHTALNNMNDVAGLRNNLGRMYQDQGNLDMAKESYSLSLSVARELNDSSLVAACLTNLAGVYADQGNIPRAIANCYEALRIREGLNDKMGLANALGEIGVINRTQGLFAESKRNHEAALAIFEELESTFNSADELVNLGILAIDLGDRDSALIYFENSLTLMERIGDVEGIANVKTEIAEVLLKQGKYQGAIDLLSASRTIYEDVGYQIKWLRVTNLLGKAWLEAGQLVKATTLFEQALELGQELNAAEQIGFSADNLHVCYRAAGRFKPAMEMLELSTRIKDELQNTVNRKAVIRQQFQYEYDNKSTADSLAFERKAAVGVAELKAEKKTRTYLIIGLVLVLLLGGGILNRYQVTRKQKKVIEQNAKELAQMDEIKSRFFTNISHEFRTPLTLILGPAQKLLKEKQEKSDRSGVKELRVIARNGERLRELIDQILDLNKLEAGKLDEHIIQGDAANVILHLFRSLSSLAEARSIDLIAPDTVDPILMDHDREKLTKVVQNLVSNAVKFTPKGGSIELQLRSNAEALIFTVKDTGLGIAAQDLPHVFDRFYQSSETPDDQVGSGVGLALTKELVRSMDGQVSVVSEMGKGSVFTVSLPISNLAAVEESVAEIKERIVISNDHPEELVAVETSDLPIALVVEDNDDMRQYVASCLEGEFAIALAENGQVGVEKAIELVPDVIVSDVMMPVKDGFQLCEEVKQDKRTSHIPLILLTARADVEDRIAGLKRGADDYLSKPFHAEELLLRLRNALSLKNKLQARYAKGVPEVQDTNSELEQEDAFMIKMKEHLENNLDNSDYGAPEIGRELGVSRTQFFRKVKALTGETPANYVRRLRLMKAKDLIMDPEMRIAEVAYAVGFSDPKYFSKSFSKEFGQSPKQFREDTHS